MSAAAEWEAWVPMSVSAHLYPDTDIRSVVHPQEDRAVLTLSGTNWADVRLFVDRPELVRMRDELAAMLAELDAAAVTVGDSGDGDAA